MHCLCSALPFHSSIRLALLPSCVLLLSGLVGNHCFGQEEDVAKPLDRSKSAIELPVERIIGGDGASLFPTSSDLATESSIETLDVAKSFTEVPLQRSISDSLPRLDRESHWDAGANFLAEEPQRSGSPNSKDFNATANLESDNPQVVPGKVDWRKDFKSARKASRKTGRPVLHFQLLGQLDQRFT